MRAFALAEFGGFSNVMHMNVESNGWKWSGLGSARVVLLASLAMLALMIASPSYGQGNTIVLGTIEAELKKASAFGFGQDPKVLDPPDCQGGFGTWWFAIGSAESKPLQRVFFTSRRRAGESGDFQRPFGYSQKSFQNFCGPRGFNRCGRAQRL